jgi:threonine aldolase
MNFISDNASPVHPKVMAALAAANEGYAKPYGDDAIMDMVRRQIRDLFEAPEAAVYLVSTGSAANSLALASFIQPWQTIYTHAEAHINIDECGAPEFFTGGAKLVALGGDHAKLSPQTVESAIHSTPVGDVHTYQRGVVSITNTSEAGTVYTCAEVAALSAVAKQHSLPLHMDGARFANAITALDCSPAELTWKSGVDILSFGGTKNGLMGVEAVVMFDAKKAWEFELRRKRGGHLLSKHRYLSAQMQAYLTDNLWLEMARAANARAARLADGLARIDGIELAHPVQANMVFPLISRAKHRAAMGAGAVYSLAPFGTSLEGDMDEILASRMVCSWCTTEGEVDQLLELL